MVLIKGRLLIGGMAMLLKMSEDGVLSSVDEDDLVYVSEKELNSLLEENEQLKQEKELIKYKLLKYILNYNKIANDNYNMGLSESVEQIHDEIKELFENPTNWRYLFSCDECTHFKSEKDHYDKAYCQKFKKEISYFEETDCKEFEWK